MLSWIKGISIPVELRVNAGSLGRKCRYTAVIGEWVMLLWVIGICYGCLVYCSLNDIWCANYVVSLCVTMLFCDVLCLLRVQTACLWSGCRSLSTPWCPPYEVEWLRRIGLLQAEEEELSLLSRCWVYGNNSAEHLNNDKPHVMECISSAVWSYLCMIASRLSFVV